MPILDLRAWAPTYVAAGGVPQPSILRLRVLTFSVVVTWRRSSARRASRKAIADSDSYPETFLAVIPNPPYFGGVNLPAFGGESAFVFRGSEL
jgi:hypothetical protein